MRKINREEGNADIEAGVWEVSNFIDEYFKPEADATLSARLGYSERSWQRIISAASKSNVVLDRERVAIIRREIARAQESAEGEVHVLLTGRGARSATFVAALRHMVAAEYPLCRVHECVAGPT